MYGSVQPSTWLTSHQSTGPSFCVGSDGLLAQPAASESTQPKLASNLLSTGGAQPLAMQLWPGPPLPPILHSAPLASQPHLGQKRVAARPSSGMSKSCEAPPASFTSALNGTAPAKLAMKSGVSQPFTMRSRPAGSAPPSAGADVVVSVPTWW